MIRQIAVPPFDSLDPFLPKPFMVDKETREQVTRILADVNEWGDSAVREWTRKLDGTDLEPSAWELPRSEWDNALERIDIELREALEAADARVREYHKRQRDIASPCCRGRRIRACGCAVDRGGCMCRRQCGVSQLSHERRPVTEAGVEEMSPDTAGADDAVRGTSQLPG